jgi:DNA ligase-1
MPSCIIKRKGSFMLFLRDLVEISEKVGATPKKKEKASFLAQFFRRAREKEISLSAFYLSGELPQGRLGIGWATLQEALKEASFQPNPLGLIDLDLYFESIAREKGSGSSGRKVQTLREILSRSTERENEFLAKLIMGEIRQGALQGLVLEALAQATSLPIDLLQRSLMFSGNIGDLARVAMEEGVTGLSKFQPNLFRPISPMLASPVEGEDEAIERLGEAGWEYKIDGARIQVHKEGKEIRIFTRHLREITESLPEIVHLASKLPMDKVIFEGEAIALREDGRPFSFQTTMRRFGRIQDVETLQKKISLKPFFFDLLYLDGESLIETSYRDRFGELSERIPPEYLIPRIVTADSKKVQSFLIQSLKAGHEGLMAKGLDSTYVAGQRGFLWLKIKPAQTLDLVVLAAEWGHGRRKGWLSNLHLGARDEESRKFVMLGKTFKGLTDEMLQWQTKRLLHLEIGRDEWTVYVRPELVVEIAFNDIQESPHYPGRLALRFARVKRFREDKSPLEADTFQKVRAIFESDLR